ncbi:Scarecrow-like protein 32 [Glycine soja]|uniref:Scarecrow-like protein 32 n=1 Tax=Glycine soja TaxID=3848 RepID=A0A0B2PEI5_GLYSO|nr:Scarecrow-like protein 32 [Glycine soja]
MNKNQIPRPRPWPAACFPTTSKALSNFGDANCMEQLLVHCANAIETNDVTLAQQILWVLNNIAPPDGDSNQRLASGFLRALTAHNIPPMLDLSYDELGAKLVNFARSRNMVMEFRVVSSSYRDGFAGLIEHLRVQQQHFVYAAESRTTPSEALVINCHMMLHYIPDETLSDTTGLTSFLYDSSSLAASSAVSVTPTSSLRSLFLKSLRGLDPTVVILVDEDADLTSNNLVCRLRSAFNYLWIPYDTVDTFLPRGSKQRQWYEADICWKIENVIAHEGVQRVERVEPKNRWEQRMKNASFQGVAFSEDSVAEVKAMLDEHAAGWGLKKEDEHIVLTWKGHNVVFASAWLPA